MIKAKRLKLIKSALLLSGGVSVIASLSVVAYAQVKRKGVQNFARLEHKEVTPKLSDKVNIIIKKEHDSLTDSNVEEQKAITTLQFVYNGDVISTKEIETDPNVAEKAVDINDDIPKGYTIDLQAHPAAKPIVVVMGKVNVIHVVPIKVITVTKIQFRDGNTDVGQLLTFEITDANQLDLNTLVPSGYKLKDDYVANIIIGDINVIPIEKIRVEKTTVLNFNIIQNGLTALYKAVNVKSFDDETVDPRNYIPEGFEFVDPNVSAALAAGQKYDFIIRQTETQYSTTITYIDNATSANLATRVFNTRGDQTLSFSQIQQGVPSGYELPSTFDPSTINRGAINTVRVSKINQIYRTRFIFKTVAGIIVKEETRESFQNRPLVLETLIPQGYKLVANQSRDIIYNQTNTYVVEQVVTPKINPAPQPNPTPTPSTPPTPSRPAKPGSFADRSVNKLSAEEIRRYISDGGSVVSGDRRYDKPSRIDNDNNPPLSTDEKNAARKKIAGLEAAVNKLLSGKKLAFEDLKPFSDAASDSWLSDVIIPMLNGEDSGLSRFGRTETPEEIKINFKAQIDAARASFESELAKGRVPRISFSGGSYNVTFGTPGTNPTERDIISNNKNRAFGVDNYPYIRNGGLTLKGDYVGWKKEDISKTYEKQIGKPLFRTESDGKLFIDGDGIAVYNYKPNEDNAVGQKQGESKAAFVDASNDKGISKILSFLQKNSEISGVYIRNIGSKNPQQNISDIIKALPSSIKKVTLFFDTQYTYGVSELKNHHLDQVELLTTYRPNIDDNLGDNLSTYKYGWGIDPIAFKNTKYVAFDYNNTNAPDLNGSRQVQVGPIVFGILRPDATDTLEEISEGFKLALDTHKDWRVFNGDHGDQGYPTKIDLSLTKFKSLKGIYTGPYYFKAIKLPSKGTTFTFNLSDLKDSQFEKIIANWGPGYKPKILFSDPQTTKIYIKGGVSDLGRGWVKNLQGLLTGLANNSEFKTIIVDNKDVLDILKQSPGWDSRFQVNVGTDQEVAGGFNFD